MMMAVTPPYKAPDEEAHLLRACEVADGILYNKTPAENVQCDNYIRKNMKLNRPEGVYQVTGYPPLLYFVSALGLKIGQIWGGKIMFYLGRIFNFFSSVNNKKDKGLTKEELKEDKNFGTKYFFKLLTLNFGRLTSTNLVYCLLLLPAVLIILFEKKIVCCYKRMFIKKLPILFFIYCLLFIRSLNYKSNRSVI